MNWLRQLALGQYVQATATLRRMKLESLCRAGRAPVCVLFYHRVADHTPNAWTIRNLRFQSQLQWISQRADMVSLPEAQRRLREGNDRLAVSVTFDDGYADNCTAAIPFLIRHNIPCTYFVSLEFAERGRPFPHDAQRDRPLAPNTIAQLKRMVDEGIVIGGHTRTHCDMGAIDNEHVIHDEVIRSSRELSNAVGGPVEYFAFPFGQPKNLNHRAAELALQHNFRGVLSAYGEYNLPSGGDSFHLRRIHGDPEMARLRNWLTLDPRKIGDKRDTCLRDFDPVSPCEVSA